MTISAKLRDDEGIVRATVTLPGDAPANLLVVVVDTAGETATADHYTRVGAPVIDGTDTTVPYYQTSSAEVTWTFDEA